ncbi:MAG: ECF transporter S component [Clostridiales bacterium]|nr:ECF transporter S component [Clostridiales bacterium]
MRNKDTFNTLNIVTTAMLSAVAIVLASMLHHLFGWQIGVLFSPMHFPVLLMGILCGPWLGLIGGTLTPVISFLTSGGPQYTTLVPMIFELAMYGFLTGMLRSVFLKNPKTNRFASVIALVLAMIGGRLLNAIVGATIYAIIGEMPFFVALGTKLVGNFTSTWAGILVQLVLIPAILFALQRSGVLVKYLPDSPN